MTKKETQLHDPSPFSLVGDRIFMTTIQSPIGRLPRSLTMSSRPSRRGGAPTSLSLAPQPKLTISVEEWEAKAPLSDLHLRSVNAIKLASEKVPLPLKVRQTYIPYLKYKGVLFV